MNALVASPIPATIEGLDFVRECFRVMVPHLADHWRLALVQMPNGNAMVQAHRDEVCVGYDGNGDPVMVDDVEPPGETQRVIAVLKSILTHYGEPL